MAFLKKPELKTVKSTTFKTALTGDVQQKIQQRAYDIYQQRGFKDGNDLDDWFQAEREITREILRQPKKASLN
ncbi:MAG TPA: DUF2934 domain-containing protein [Candidatus Omnitrophota bacterium]|nr:DUF2934 domain-containing protein [Candidatus Omnitrophota bacterium]